MHPSKSNLLFIGSYYNLNYEISEQPVVVNDQPISRTSAHKCLGVHMDEKLSCDCHVDTICKKVSAGIGAMRCIKNFVPVASLETVYKGLVQPYFEYCTPLWDTCGKLLNNKLQRFQSRAAIVLKGASYNYDARSSLSFCRGSRVEGSMSRARVPCRGSRVTFFFPKFFFGKGNN